MLRAMDRIDEILAQWRRERPGLDAAALGTVGRLFLVVQLAGRRLAGPLAELDLQRGWFDLLAALRRSGRPYVLNPTELARTTMLSSGGMTKRLDRMAEAGLVERLPDPDDRRGTLVRLTPKGKRRIDRALERHIANEDRILRPLRPADRRELDRLLRLLLQELQEG